MSKQTEIKEPTLKRLRQSWGRAVMADKDFSILENLPFITDNRWDKSKERAAKAHEAWVDVAEAITESNPEYMDMLQTGMLNGL